MGNYFKAIGDGLQNGAAGPQN